MKKYSFKCFYSVIVFMIFISMIAITVSCSNPITGDFTSIIEKQTKEMDYTKFSIKVGSKDLTIDDSMKLLLNAPVIEIDGNSYIPLRFFLDWFKAKHVKYNEVTEEITFDLPRNDEIDNAVLEKYKNPQIIKKETEGIVKQEEKQETKPINDEKYELALNMMKELLKEMGEVGFNEELKAFTVTPTSADFLGEVSLAVQGNAEYVYSWNEIIVPSFKEVSKKLNKTLPGYSVALLNPISTDKVLLLVKNGAVIYNVVNP